MTATGTYGHVTRSTNQRRFWKLIDPDTSESTKQKVWNSKAKSRFVNAPKNGRSDRKWPFIRSVSTKIIEKTFPVFYKRNGSDSVAFEMNSIFFFKKEKKRNLQQNVNSQVKSHREIAGPDVLLQFWCSFLLLLFSLSLAPFFFTARWLSLRFLRWFSPEPVSYEVPKRAEMESSSFLSPQKTHRINDIQVKFFGNKKTNMGR